MGWPDLVEFLRQEWLLRSRSYRPDCGTIFQGDSLTLGNGVNFIIKRSIGATFIIESGAIFTAGADKTVNGNLLVADGESMTINSTSRIFTFDASISGSGTITVTGGNGH